MNQITYSQYYYVGVIFYFINPYKYNSNFPYQNNNVPIINLKIRNYDQNLDFDKRFIFNSLVIQLQNPISYIFDV